MYGGKKRCKVTIVRAAAAGCERRRRRDSWVVKRRGENTHST